MTHDLKRRVFVIEEVDSGAFMFDSLPAALRWLQLHLGLDEKWKADDLPEEPPLSFTFGSDGSWARVCVSPGYTTLKPEERFLEFEDHSGHSVKFKFKVYTLLDNPTIEPAFRLFSQQKSEG